MQKLFSFTTLVLLTMLILSACGPAATPVPTATPVDIAAIKTQAVSEFAFGLTQTSIANPTATPTETFTPTATFTPMPTNTGGIPTLASTLQPTQSCYSMAFVKDVTIPDNTPIAPGQTFTKTWKVVNNGSCNWESGFKFVFVGGNAMGGATVTIDKAVAPNAQVDLSVDMTAPTDKTGSIQSNWRMQTAAGVWFGDEVYVIINVGGATLTPTATATLNGSETPTATPTETATPTPTP